MKPNPFPCFKEPIVIPPERTNSPNPAMLSDDELHTLTKDHAGWVADCLSDGDHSGWMPHLMVSTMAPDGKGGVERSLHFVALNVPFSTDDEKRSAMVGVGTRFAMNNSLPLAAVLSTEAWRSQQLPAGMRPADDAFREEIILVAGMSVQRTTCVITAKVDRVDGKIPGVQFEALNTERVHMGLLSHFYRGFASMASKLMDGASRPGPRN